mmetsp:Transcript_36414/g.96833  ORF Transcript_36414/g.96833 Transcript_36414/m.96833 type:complete len:91 (+) Transcript_36414:2-274(+)
MHDFHDVALFAPSPMDVGLTPLMSAAHLEDLNTVLLLLAGQREEFRWQTASAFGRHAGTVRRLRDIGTWPKKPIFMMCDSVSHHRNYRSE